MWRWRKINCNNFYENESLVAQYNIFRTKLNSTLKTFKRQLRDSDFYTQYITKISIKLLCSLFLAVTNSVFYSSFKLLFCSYCTSVYLHGYTVTCLFLLFFHIFKHARYARCWKRQLDTLLDHESNMPVSKTAQFSSSIVLWRILLFYCHCCYV